ncbi:MAG: DUF3822 family protein [Ginsengibacter sp.]
MNAVFEIINEDINTANCVLLCEVSNDGLSYLVKDTETNIVLAFAVYHYNTNIHGNLNSIFQKIFEDHLLFSEKFKKVFIIYSLPESVLIPFPLYDANNNADILKIIHGDLAENHAIRTDMLIANKVYNSYRVPLDLITEIGSKFPAGEVYHQYSVLMKNLSSTGDKFSVIFYPQKIVLTLEVKGKLLLINSYHYKSPEDVSYILLNICRQFELKNIPVELSGLIEKDSGLYKEIYKYFEQVSFAQPPEGINFSEKLDAYPSHYFSHFFGVEICE